VHRSLPPATLLLPATVLLVAGCAINPRLDLGELQVGAKPVVSLDAPFFPQTGNQCGPAALATVLTAAGVATRPEELSAQVYLPEREGSLQVELLAATRRHGRIPFPLDPKVDALLAEVTQGRPVLVLQNLRTRSLPAWHYAVLVGYDTQRNTLQLNSGEDQGLWVEAPSFLRTWDWAGRWALVALRPGELPAELDRDAAAEPAPQSIDRYLRAVADFEVVAGTQAAAPAWQAAASNWPQHRWPALALGNQAYASGDLALAALWYHQGLTANPQDPALANNLAAVLGEAGCARAGEALLRPVATRLDADSPWRSSIEATLQELAARTGLDPASCTAYVAPSGEVATLPPP